MQTRAAENKTRWIVANLFVCPDDLPGLWDRIEQNANLLINLFKADFSILYRLFTCFCNFYFQLIGTGEQFSFPVFTNIPIFVD